MRTTRLDEAIENFASRGSELLVVRIGGIRIGYQLPPAQLVQRGPYALERDPALVGELGKIVVGVTLDLYEQPRRERR